MYYEEWIDGAWHRLGIDGEMLTGRAHHVIYFASPEHWQNYPEWARHRRDEIIDRIKSEFREPDYEYSSGGTAGAAVGKKVPSPVTASSATPQQRRALLLAVVLVLGIAVGMAWLVGNGLRKGETYLPGKRASQQRSVLRSQEPALFWGSIGIYSAIGLGALGLAVWGIRQKV